VISFVGKARSRDRRGKLKDEVGKIVAKRILKCIDFLRQPEIGLNKVRSVIGDETMTSEHLVKELEDRGVKRLLALKSSSRLRKYIPKIKRWTKLDDGRLIGIKRNII
jgi:hypothetical protein